MKKLTTKIMDDGDEKDIAVFLDDETAKVLEECGDEELKHRYIPPQRYGTKRGAYYQAR